MCNSSSSSIRRANRAPEQHQRRSDRPPGTGVSSPARSDTAGSTSPTRPSSVRLIPTSTTAAPGFTIAGVTMRGTPTAATIRSAREVRGEVPRGVADRHGRVPVEEEQLPACRRCRCGRSRPRSRPELDAVLVEEREHAEWRSRHVPGRAGEEQAGVDGMEAVDVLDRVDSADHAPFVDPPRQARQLDEDPVDRVVGVQRDEAEQLRLAVAAGRRRSRPRSRPRASPCACPDVDASDAGSSPMSTVASPIGAERRHLGGDLGANPGRESLPVHHRRRHGARISSPGEVAPKERRRLDRARRR